MLMMLADGDERWRDDGRAFIRGPDGRHLSASGIALVARWTPTRVAKALKKLVEVRTLGEDPQYGFFFRNYRKHQENPSAARKRKQRDSHVNVPVTVTGTVTGEAEAEAEERREKQKEQSVAAAKRPATRRAKPPSLDARAAAQYLYDAIRAHSPQFLSNAKPAGVERKITGWARDIDVGLRNDGMTLQGCRQAVDAAHGTSDPFWRSNLLSGKKLRQHYEKLRIRRASNDQQTPDYSGIDFAAVAQEMDSWKTRKPNTSSNS